MTSRGLTPRPRRGRNRPAPAASAGHFSKTASRALVDSASQVTAMNQARNVSRARPSTSRPRSSGVRTPRYLVPRPSSRRPRVLDRRAAVGERGRRRLPPGLFARRVFQAEQGVSDPTVRQDTESRFTQVAEIDDVTSVLSPYAPGADAFQVSQQGPAAGTIAIATVNLPEAVDSTRTADVADEVREVLREVDILAAEATRRLAGSDGRDW